MKTRFINAYRGNTFFLMNILKDLKDEDMMLNTGESNTIGWILGHITHSRGSLLKRFNKDVEIKEFEKNFERGAVKNKDLKVNLAETLKDFSSRGEMLAGTFEEFTDEDFNKDLGIPMPGGKSDAATVLSFLTWHETFHIGQIDLIKAACGKGGIK
ncbi:MAG: DinB family protein [Ignavibacteriales bacterium]|nr:MAG: DinB family protein [Ignavibacteriales bacterium]